MPTPLQALLLLSCLLRFPELPRADSSSYQLGRGCDETETQERQETTVQPWGRVPAPLQGMHMLVSVSSFAGTPTQEEDVRFLFPVQAEHEIPVSSPPTNQKRVTCPAALPPHFVYKNFSPRIIEELRVFECEPPVLLSWPFDKTYSAPDYNLLVCLASLCIGPKVKIYQKFREKMSYVIDLFGFTSTVATR